jgi:hypothetical protein
LNPDATLRCHLCGDVIGAYEPVIALVEGKPTNTVRRAVLGGELEAPECYHDACFTPTPTDPGAT